jgi:hypothetical protein
MKTEQIANGAKPLALPLKKLADLIKSDLSAITQIEVEEAELMAGRINERAMKYRIAIGEKLLAAKEQVKHGHFEKWVKTNFPIGYSASKEWMRMAKAQNFGGPKFSSAADLHRKTRKPRKGGTGISAKRRAEWKKIEEKRMEDFLRDFASQGGFETFEAETETQSQEQKLINKMAGEIVNAGYKLMATRLHPDKGGSEDGMRRLNAAREQLRRCINGR